jgi:hypothetical protein
MYLLHYYLDYNVLITFIDNIHMRFWSDLLKHVKTLNRKLIIILLLLICNYQQLLYLYI